MERRDAQVAARYKGILMNGSGINKGREQTNRKGISR